MIEVMELDEALTLDDYASVAHLTATVSFLRTEAGLRAPAFRGRRVWMVNSTEMGGGVAEMLPRLVSLLNELGIETRWAVIRPDDPHFFELTKRLHNLIHGSGDPKITADDAELYERVSRRCADAFLPLLKPHDIVIVHDPQPMGMGALVSQELDLRSVWRCHIGTDEKNAATRSAWSFLENYAAPYDHAVFSTPEYIPEFLTGRASVIHPAIDPLSHKNRELSVHKLTGVLCNAGLATEIEPVLTSPFEHQARRLSPDGSFAPPSQSGEIGLAFRPTVLQVSRWDRLKGWEPLLDAFVALKRERTRRRSADERHRRRLEIVRLILAGPDPAAIQDDPEAVEVFERLEERYLSLEPEIQTDVVLLVLPVHSRKENALMVNALQRCASVVVQNSIREGFGLTVTEAMWKRTAILGSRTPGIRTQIREGLEGRLAPDPEDSASLCQTLDEMLADPIQRQIWARNAQRRAHEDFLVFTQVRRWIETLSELIES